MFSRFRNFLPLAAPALFALTSLAQDIIDNKDSTCYSFGIDFVDGGSYFINTNSNEPFTTVSQFEGCNSDVADVILQDPNGNEYDCGTLPTTPDDVSQMATCPITKSQMFSGEWIIFLLGNNLDGNPFAYTRNIALTCAPQETVTTTSTVWITSTITPTVTSTSTSVTTITSKFPATTTVTQPKATAKNAVTVYPKATTITQIQTLTRTKVILSKTLGHTTVTQTATCTIPSKPAHGDPTCTRTQTLKPWPTGIHLDLVKREADMPANKRRLAGEIPRLHPVWERDLVGRSADSSVITVLAPVPVTSSTTITGPAQTVVVPTTATSIISVTAPPPTVFAGTFTSTITAPTPTRTKVSYKQTTVTSTKTISLIWTYTTSVTPTASVTPCKHHGGHFIWPHRPW
ncbi:MAG: hypothetical protein M1820_003329 [Bogoriella megaspora]|nr:MAG: hypothetical protein M1820_003329 [Bogoriella megaspora]